MTLLKDNHNVITPNKANPDPDDFYKSLKDQAHCFCLPASDSGFKDATNRSSFKPNNHRKYAEAPPPVCLHDVYQSS